MTPPGVTYSTDLSDVTDFGLALYKRLSSPDSRENFFFSPYSIWNALTFAYFASAGNTQREMEAALRVSDKVSTFFALERTGTIKTRSKRLINAFVNEVTRGRIPEIVQESDVKDALMVIVNAAYFKGTWKTQFDPAKTRPRNFFFSQSQSAPLDMMSLFGEFRYGESANLGARLLELPYAGDDVSMILLLPQTRLAFGQRFVNMVTNLNSTTLREALSPRNMALTKVDILLPKFKFSHELRDELKMALREMGIIDLFHRERANMAAFTNTEGLYVDKIIHKAFVEVNEEGTEAAAATALILPVRSFNPNQPEQFYCEEPFVFMIYDRRTDNVLFLGAIQNPRG